MEGQGAEILSKDRIISYTVKKRVVVATAAVVLSIIALCFVNLNSSVPIIAVPVIIAAAFVIDKLLILIRFDIYGKDMIRRGRTPVIATCTVVSAFTAICLLSGIVGYQLALYSAKNANVVKTFVSLDEAVDYVQSSGLEDKYDVTVEISESEAVFVPKQGECDLADFDRFDEAEERDGAVIVRVRTYRLEYKGEEHDYYVLNQSCLNAKIEVSEGKFNVVDYGTAFGKVLGAAFGAVAQIAILAIVYVIGIIAAIVPSEIYFEKLIRAEAKKAEENE